MSRRSIGGEHRGSRPVAAALVVAVLAVSCSSHRSGSDQAADASTTSSSRPVVTTTTAPVDTSSTTAPGLDLKTADLQAGTYKLICPGGEVTVAAARGTAADGRSVSVTRFEPQFTDVTGDGRPDAIVAVNCRADGDPTAGSDSVIVLTAPGRTITQLGAPIDGTDPVVVGRAIAVSHPAPGSEAPATVATTTAPATAGSVTGGTASSTTAPAAPQAPPATTLRYQAYAFSGDTWGTPPETAPAEGDVATMDGLDPYVVGAPYGEIALTSGQPVDVSDPLGSKGACVNVTYPSGPDDVSSLGSEGTVRSVIVANSGVRTVEGVGVGSSATAVEDAYPDQVTPMVSADEPSSRFLVVHPEDVPDRTMMFTIRDDAVTRYAVGESGWADVVKGCS